ncbi:MAG TPA: BON domain-containing protein [Quisquiliibacterium sp.]|jgi:osmotically-inducible protein OsmY|nr:BON domain-containing protein [Quisquiliibacterium sp.]HPA90358.1 BON domain-containing protein [Quisquiliibacterium sp.]HQD82790.1 BON domain-containing protein [Quisquiliibacterium sp.]
MIAHRSARPFPRRLASAAVASALVAATLSLSGCFPLAATGVAVGVLAATDRRTIGTQTEDTGIEVKAASRLREELKNAGGISVTSFNRKVLITGQVIDDTTRQAAERIVAGVENVRSVHNELQVSGRVSLGTTASDATISTRVKAAFVDAKDLQANTVKVVTEAGVVYLMGIVSRAEGDRAAQVASRVSGVTRVVTVFEYASADEIARIERRSAQESQAK